MTTREELYRQFGAILLEAIVLTVKNEINILRKEHGLTPRTDQQVMNKLQNTLDSLPLYDWMTKPKF